MPGMTRRSPPRRSPASRACTASRGPWCGTQRARSSTGRPADRKETLMTRRHLLATDPQAAGVTVRLASSRDAWALDRLAQLDSARSPTGPTLVAEIEGQLVAALPLRGGRPVADPLRPTAELVELPEIRATP